MKRKKVRLAVLLFMLFNILLAACAQSGVSPAKNTPEAEPTPSAELDIVAAEPTPEPTPEPDDGWREAYAAAAEELEREFPTQEGSADRILYKLINFDSDAIPEMSACVDGYCVSLYSYREGEMYTLMDRWVYGAMGNMGYEYCPWENSLRNFNSDYAGLIMYTTYMSIGPEMTLEQTAQIVTYSFDDANGNGVPDEDEYESAFEHYFCYYNGEEISGEEAEAFDAGEYKFINGTMSYEELLSKLKK